MPRMPYIQSKARDEAARQKAQKALEREEVRKRQAAEKESAPSRLMTVSVRQKTRGSAGGLLNRQGKPGNVRRMTSCVFV